MVIIFTFLYGCYILIFEKFDKVTLCVRNFAVKIFSNLGAGNLIPCVVFIAFVIYMASVNQVVRCDKNFVMVVVSGRELIMLSISIKIVTRGASLE